VLLLRPIRPADSRALLVSVLRTLDRHTPGAFTRVWTRPNTR
jgi:hypothetical protein